MDSSQQHNKGPVNRNVGGMIPVQNFETPRQDYSRVAPPFSSGSDQMQGMFFCPTSGGIQGSSSMPSSRFGPMNYSMGNTFLNNYNATTSAMNANMSGHWDPRGGNQKVKGDDLKNSRNT